MRKKVRIERDWLGYVTRYEETQSSSLFDSIFDDDDDCEVIVVGEVKEVRPIEVEAPDGSAGGLLGALVGAAIGALVELGAKKRAKKRAEAEEAEKKSKKKKTA